MTKITSIDYFLSLSLAVILGTLLYATTPLGLGMSPDSVGYIMGARGIATESSLKGISNQWPPLYPLALGIIAKLTNLDVLISARLLQSAIFSCLAGSMLLMQIRIGIKRSFAIFSTLTLILNPTLLYVIYYVWSEGLFFILLCMNVYFAAELIERLDKNQPYKTVCFLLAVTASLGFASRYVGITIVLFNILLFVYLHNKYNQIKNLLFVYFSTIIIITTPWIIYYYQLSETLTRRELTWHPIALEQLTLGIRTVGQSFLPWKTDYEHIHIIVGILILGAALFIFLQIYKRRTLTISDRFQFLLLSYAFIYFNFLIFSISLIDIATPLDERILFPVCSILLIVIPIYFFTNSRCTHFFYTFITIFFAIYIYHCLQNGNAWIRLNMYSGVELTSKSNRDRLILTQLSLCPPQYKIASNAPWEFEIDLNRQLSWLPRPFDMTSGKANSLFENQIKNLANHFDVIVVTQSEKNIYIDIGPLTGYVATYTGGDGTVWVRQDRLDSCRPSSR